MAKNNIYDILDYYKDYCIRTLSMGDKPDSLFIDNCEFVLNLLDNDGNAEIEIVAIQDSESKKIIIPNIVNSFNIKDVFLSNYKLEKIFLGDKVERIGDNVFNNCHYLKTINLEKVKYIGNFSFLNCMSLEKVKLKDIISIGVEAFSNCKSLTFVDLGGSIESLNSSVFRQNPLLKKVIGTNSLKMIGTYCFSNCRHLKTINLSSVESLMCYSFAFCYDLLHANLSNLQYLEEACFYKCESLKSVDLPKTIKKLTQNLFYCCHNLTSVKNLEFVEELDRGSFYGSGLEVADLRNCKTIGREAFLNSNISVLKISDKLSYVGDEAFGVNMNVVNHTFRDDKKSDYMHFFKDKELIIKYYGDKENPLDDIKIGKKNEIFKNAKIIRMS